VQGVLDPNQLAGMSWEDLFRLRDQNPTDQTLAPYEHRAFARERVRENPFMAPAYGVLVPGYQAYKAMMGNQSGTPASWDQLKHGFLGIGEGLKSGVLDSMNAMRKWR
jgi:hypothetical protein